jgi:hypothetical protein
MRRRTLIFAQTRLRAVDYLAQNHPDVNPNGKDVRIISTSARRQVERIRGLSGFDYIMLDGWDFFLNKKEVEEVWRTLMTPGIDARQLSPESLAPLQ